jgi:mono/diheme cytochrome c family protein
MLKLVPGVIAFAAMGGWAVVTVKDVPEYFVAGKEYTVEFQVRQHGRHLMNNVEPELIVSGASGQRVRAARRGEGTYAATFVAPAAGQVSLTIKSGWGASNLSLYPVPVIATGAKPAAMAQADRGRVLYVAKGCNSCHSNIDLVDRPDNQQIKAGPELGGRHLAPALVIQKIKNPASENMPNLGLSDAEAAAIAAFLSGGTATSGGGGR